jgi:hypothetical protein
MKHSCLHIILAAALTMLIAAGCAGLSRPGTAEDYVTTSYKTLKAAKILYDETLTAAADLYRMGVIDDAQKARIIAAGDKFRVSWQSAVDALYVYATADAALADRAGLDTQLVLFEAAYGEFSALARPYLIRALAK